MSVVFSRLSSIALILTAIVIAAILLVSWMKLMSDREVRNDASQNLKMAYNVSTHGIFSLDTSEGLEAKNGHPRPTNYREPFPPFMLATYLGTVQLFIGDQPLNFWFKGEGARLAKYSNLFWCLLLCLSVYAAVRTLTGSVIAGLAAVLFVGLEINKRSLDSLYTDLPAAALLALASVLLMLAIQTRGLLYFIFAGLSLGALILTKGAFLYVTAFLAVALMIWLFVQWRRGRQEVGVKLLAFFVSVMIVIGPWIIRNYVTFGTFSVTERGGVVLMLRAKYNNMSWTEYLGSFYVWAPRDWRTKIGEVLGFSPDDLKRGGRLQHLNRSRGAEFVDSDYAAELEGRPEDAVSYYRKARAERVKVEMELMRQGHSNPENAGDVELRNRAMALILQNPSSHVALTLPFAWRGAAVVAPLLVFFAALAFWRRRFDVIAYMLPALGLVAFLAFATHNIPRYNEPVEPIVTVLIVVALWALFQRAWNRIVSNKPKQTRAQQKPKRRKRPQKRKQSAAPLVRPGPHVPAIAPSWNQEVYNRDSVVVDFVRRSSLYPAEQVVFDKLSSLLVNARVIDIGVGGGRTTSYLLERCASYEAIDYSEPMIQACRSRFPDYDSNLFQVGDARDLSAYPRATFDIAVFSANGIDYVSHKERLGVLSEIRAVLRNDGLFFFSTHSLEGFPFSDPEIMARNTHVDFDALHAQGWYHLVDRAPDVVTYYITPELQIQQLASVGFEVVEILDMKGEPLLRSQSSSDWMLHFLCKAVI